MMSEHLLVRLQLRQQREDNLIRYQSKLAEKLSGNSSGELVIYILIDPFPLIDEEGLFNRNILHCTFKLCFLRALFSLGVVFLNRVC